MFSFSRGPQLVDAPARHGHVTWVECGSGTTRPTLHIFGGVDGKGQPTATHFKADLHPALQRPPSLGGALGGAPSEVGFTFASDVFGSTAPGSPMSLAGTYSSTSPRRAGAGSPRAGCSPAGSPSTADLTVAATHPTLPQFTQLLLLVSPPVRHNAAVAVRPEITSAVNDAGFVEQDDSYGRAFIYGGASTSGLLEDLWYYKPSTSSWVERSATAGDAPGRRSGHSVAFNATGALFLVFGGMDAEARMPADVHALHVQTGVWQRLSVTIPPRAGVGVIPHALRGAMHAAATQRTLADSAADRAAAYEAAVAEYVAALPSRTRRAPKPPQPPAVDVATSDMTGTCVAFLPGAVASARSVVFVDTAPKPEPAVAALHVLRYGQPEPEIASDTETNTPAATSGAVTPAASSVPPSLAASALKTSTTSLLRTPGRGSPGRSARSRDWDRDSLAPDASAVDVTLTGLEEDAKPDEEAAEAQPPPPPVPTHLRLAPARRYVAMSNGRMLYITGGTAARKHDGASTAPHLRRGPDHGGGSNAVVEHAAERSDITAIDLLTGYATTGEFAVDHEASDAASLRALGAREGAAVAHFKHRSGQWVAVIHGGRDEATGCVHNDLRAVWLPPVVTGLASGGGIARTSDVCDSGQVRIVVPPALLPRSAHERIEAERPQPPPLADLFDDKRPASVPRRQHGQDLDADAPPWAGLTPEEQARYFVRHLDTGRMTLEEYEAATAKLTSVHDRYMLVLETTRQSTTAGVDATRRELARLQAAHLLRERRQRHVQVEPPSSAHKVTMSARTVKCSGWYKPSLLQRFERGEALEFVPASAHNDDDGPPVAADTAATRASMEVHDPGVLQQNRRHFHRTKPVDSSVAPKPPEGRSCGVSARVSAAAVHPGYVPAVPRDSKAQYERVRARRVVAGVSPTADARPSSATPASPPRPTAAPPPLIAGEARNVARLRQPPSDGLDFVSPRAHVNADRRALLDAEQRALDARRAVVSKFPTAARRLNRGGDLVGLEARLQQLTRRAAQGN